MTHIELLEATVLKAKYAPKKELLPIQKLTKEEKLQGQKTTLDLENDVQLMAITKCWINQDRTYETWVKTCSDYAAVAIDERLNKAFFYKSGIQEALPSVKNFTRKQMNMLFEAIYMELIPAIISDYEFKRDYNWIRGSNIVKALDILDEYKCMTADALYKKVYYEYFEDDKKKRLIKIRDSVTGGVARGYITYNLDATKKHNQDFFKIDDRVEKIDGKWYFYKGVE